ncbi:MAG TPA: 6-bladed beta-propeller [Candidatus Latescibacteria bacterium]|nr:6-bladed beta-propeller [Candidatus Handelsmanbacteria bacterium]HIL07663.1 6-bladed beta-propeller [Candidatus Latescibacterota bacterium]
MGERKAPGSDEKHLNLPTDVAVLQDGSFYVSDGYGNTRVVKFSAQGEFLFEWGTPGSGPGEFDLPHGIAVDENERVFVADRSNSRIQIFDSTGTFIAEWKSQGLGRPYSMAIGSDNSVYVVDGGDPIFPFRAKAIKFTVQGALRS